MKNFCMCCNAVTIQHHVAAADGNTVTEYWTCDACGHNVYATSAPSGSGFEFPLETKGDIAQSSDATAHANLILEEKTSVLGIEPPSTLRLDQIAYYCSTPEAERRVKEMYGLENAVWVKDAVTARGTVRGKQTTNVALLQFNMDLGIQLEMIRYKAGLHWLNHLVAKKHPEPFIAHIGVHLAEGAGWPDFPERRLVQEVKTISHTAEHLTIGEMAGRRYHYRIYELAEGSYVKFIKRLLPQ